MTSNDQAEISFLLKAFARYCSEADAIILFEEQFGKQPTRKQLAMTNLGRFLEDRRTYFNPKENHRVRKFRQEREKYEASKINVPLYSQAWRMEQYQKIYDRAERKSLETGNPSRCLDIMEKATKDIAGFYNPKTQNVNIDNRTVNFSTLSDDEINKRFHRLLGQFNVSIPDIPLLEKGDKVIEQED